MSIAQNATFPDSETVVERKLPIIVAENNSAFTEIADCSEVSASPIESSKLKSEVLSSNNSMTHITIDENSSILKDDSVILESESIVDESSKLIMFRDIEQSLSENSGDMTCDFNLEENHDQFEDNEFNSSIDFFNDPSFLNFLENASSSSVLSNSEIVRDSLYRKFDPLYVNYLSQYNEQSNEQSNTIKDEIDDKTETSPNTSTLNNMQNDVQCSGNLRQSIGNMLISFDTPIIDKRNSSFFKKGNICDSEKIYTEDDLKKALENQEFAIRGTFLRKQKDLEELFLGKMQEFETKFQKQKCVSDSLCIMLKEAMHLVKVLSEKKKIFELKLAKAEEDKNNLKKDLDTFVDDLLNIEHTFSDFHKEFEQSTTMLKLYIKNENLMKQLENMNTQLNDKEKIYKEFQNRSLEIMDKSNIEITSPNKSSDNQMSAEPNVNCIAE